MDIDAFITALIGLHHLSWALKLPGPFQPLPGHRRLPGMLNFLILLVTIHGSIDLIKRHRIKVFKVLAEGSLLYVKLRLIEYWVNYWLELIELSCS